MNELLELLPKYLTAHLELVLSALLFGAATSVPLGVLVTRRRRLEAPILGIASIIQTIPTLALLAVMVPLLAALGLESIGFLPAFAALVLYSMLPILRNTVAGLGGVDRFVLEAARGVGMTPRQQLTRVELPLAMPVILAGLRTAVVWTVGMATLSTPVGAPSLGNFIFSGLQTRNMQAVLVGCAASAGLALLLDGLVRALGAAWEKRHRIGLAVSGGLLAALYIFAGSAFFSRSQGAPVVKIGAKTFTEQYILAEIMAGAITRAGSPAGTLPSLGSTVAFEALKSGQIDAYVDYSGTIWATILKKGEVPADRESVLATVKRELETTAGVEVVGALGFENAYALAMRRDRAESMGIAGIDDLRGHAAALGIGGDYEFFSRAEWKTIRDQYSLKFASERSMDPSILYDAAARGTVDVISAFSTDGRIAALNLVVLRDDRGAIPPYDAIILARRGLRADHPEAMAALERLVGTLSADAMRAMNADVDAHGESPRAVAKTFLDHLGAP